jgi:glycosyltransferase involved in cell wall biosynthesis
MSSKEILLSVVIPTYNYGHLLKRALDSVMSQMNDDCELVVIDDGSTDSTVQLLGSIQTGEESRVSWQRQENAGAAAARNLGLRASRGSNILYLDADDELLPGALAAVCSAFREDPAVTVVMGGRLTCWPDGRVKRHEPPFRLDPDSCRRVADYLLAKEISVSHGAVAVARHLVENRPYPESFRCREDIPVSAYWLAGGNIKAIATPLVKIHKHSDSLRHTVKVSEPMELALAEEIFRHLPTACLGLRQPYLAQRYLSLSRVSAISGDMTSAGRFLIKACQLDCTQLLAKGQLRKLLSSWIRMPVFSRNAAKIVEKM